MSISSGRLTQFSFYRWNLHAHSGHFFDPERKGKPMPIYRLELEEKRDLSPVVPEFLPILRQLKYSRKFQRDWRNSESAKA